MSAEAPAREPITNLLTVPKRHPIVAAVFLLVYPFFGSDARRFLDDRLGPFIGGILYLAPLLVMFAYVAFVEERRYRREKTIYESRMAGEAAELARQLAARNEEIRQLEELRPDIGKAEVSHPREGLIVPISQGDYHGIPAWCAIRHHFAGDPSDPTKPRLRYLWLVHTPDPGPEGEPSEPLQSSFKNAMALKREYERLGCVVELICVNDLDNARETFYKVDAAYRQSHDLYSLSPAQIVADITGGSKLMTVGIAFAGIEEQRDVQLTESLLRDGYGRAMPNPECIDARFRLVDVRRIRGPLPSESFPAPTRL